MAVGIEIILGAGFACLAMKRFIVIHYVDIFLSELFGQTFSFDDLAAEPAVVFVAGALGDIVFLYPVGRAFEDLGHGQIGHEEFSNRRLAGRVVRVLQRRKLRGGRHYVSVFIEIHSKRQGKIVKVRSTDCPQSCCSDLADHRRQYPH